jgi:glycosyltransferase involved in cell wall biosynthesis
MMMVTTTPGQRRHTRFEDAARVGAAPFAHGLRVAIVHDWLVVYGGAERVLEQLLRIFPHADLFAVVEFLPEPLKDFIGRREVRTTFVQNLPGARRRYRSYLPVMPLAIEQLDLASYDVVLSSSHAVAKGVLTGPEQMHVSYVHSPMRYAWDLQHQYLRETGLDRGLKGWAAKWLLHRLRAWDRHTANGVDHFVANSRFIRNRIRRLYRRDAQVIYPPVDVESFGPGGERDDFYLTASRLVPYKRVALLVEAFAQLPGRRLVVAGDGPERERISALAGPNVDLLGHCDDASLRELMRRARAFVFAAEEDFGIAPVEAQASGTPVIAYGRGGATESVRGLEHARPTGIFFDAQSVPAIVAAVEAFERNEHRIAPAACRENALRFSSARFMTEYAAFVQRAWSEFRGETLRSPAARAPAGEVAAG